MRGVITVNKLDIAFCLFMFAVMLVLSATDGPAPIECAAVELVE